jgi:leucyl-tRNA synthetase
VPVPEKDLPVKLPDDVSFDIPGNPLDHHPTWKHVSCPQCGGKAQRETDTLDTFFESSWYFARFCDAHNEEKAFDRQVAESWLPVYHLIGWASCEINFFHHIFQLTREVHEKNDLSLLHPEDRRNINFSLKQY